MKHNPSVKEQSLHPENIASAPAKTAARIEAPAKLDNRVLTALHAAGDKKALDMIVLDLREVASFTDYFVITSGTNQRQVQAISDEIFDRLKKAGTTAARVEGRQTAEWILLDYGDFVVHVFDDKARKFYDLERLWREAKRLDLPAEITQTSSSLRS
ncbi:MAG TPA: ribosome silencing factor [Pyrinomonadaceae bacterium]